MGPTASGKTDLAEGLAQRLDAVLLNADAFQIYRGLDIGTAKPADKSKYRLLDIRDPRETFGVGEWVQMALAEIEAAWQVQRNVVLVGGTGLNIRALMEEYDTMQGPPEPKLREELSSRLEREGLASLVEELKSLDNAVYESVDRANPARVVRAIERLRSPQTRVLFQLPPFARTKVAIDVSPEALASRIEKRIYQMVQNGWSLEIDGLRKQGYRPSDPGFRAIGYRAMWKVADGDIGLDEAISETIVETRKYAKRQRTWLRSEPNLRWLSDGPGDELILDVWNLLAFDLT